MNLFEFYTPEEDRSQIAYSSDTRKSVITFEKLSKLKKIRDTRKEENRKHDDLVVAMYATPSEEGEMGGGGFGDMGGAGGFGGAPPMGDFEEGSGMGEDFDLDMEGDDFDVDADLDLEDIGGEDVDMGDEEI